MEPSVERYRLTEMTGWSLLYTYISTLPPSTMCRQWRSQGSFQVARNPLPSLTPPPPRWIKREFHDGRTWQGLPPHLTLRSTVPCHDHVPWHTGTATSRMHTASDQLLQPEGFQHFEKNPDIPQIHLQKWQADSPGTNEHPQGCACQHFGGHWQVCKEAP